MMKKTLPGLVIAAFALLLSACAAGTPDLNPKPTPHLPEVYFTPFQQAARNNARMNNPTTYPRPNYS